MIYPYARWRDIRLRTARACSLFLSFVLLLSTAAGVSTAKAQQSTPAATISNGTIQITVNTDGSYSVGLWNGAAYTTWLLGATTGTTVNGVFYSQPAISGGQPLTGLSITYSPAQVDPKLGQFDAITENWTAGSTPFVTEFRTYASHPIAIFEQRFPNGAAGSAYTNGVSSCFPCFASGSAQAPSLRYLTFNDGFAQPKMGTGLGTIPAVAGDSYGLQGGMPLALFDQTLWPMPTAVLSPLGNFKSAVQTRKNQVGGALACGIQGQVQSIPAGFAHDTLLYAGEGVNNTFMSWGSLLQSYYGKDGSWLASDFGNQYLGYWTDRGGYYYYSYLNGSGTQTNVTDSTMLSIQNDLLSRGLPFRYYQLDSWWYYKDGGDSGATLQWDGKTDRFPATGTVGGLNAAMATAAGVPTPFTLHNRYWSYYNTYDKMNGGLYSFMEDSSTKVSCPNDQVSAPLFWPFLMDKARNSDGAAVYEQDWLQYEFLNCAPLRHDVTSARNWMLDMGAAAAQVGLDIQYCQALGSDYLESLEIPNVTEIRATGDYSYISDNWNIGTDSMLACALGLAPFKDTFWTGTAEPGSHNQIDAGHLVTETNPSLQALVATMSAGPVGTSDGIGYTDPNLVMKTCSSSGALLKPDRPATPIDRSFTSTGAPSGEVWDTYSVHGGQTWRYVEAINLLSGYNVYGSDLGISGPVVIYNYNSGQTSSIASFDASNPLGIPPTGTYAYQYYVIAPLQSTGWTLLGEIGKFCTVSARRFTSVSTDDLTVTEAGSPGEVVTTAWYALQPPYAVTADGYPVPQASTGDGWSYNAAASIVTVTWPIAAAGSTTIQLDPLQPPAAPTSLSAAASSSSAVQLSWTDNSVSESGFKVERDSGSGFSVIALVGASITNFPDTGLSPGTTYSYRVAAYDSAGASSYAGPVSALTFPAAPTSVSATPGAGSVALAWASVSSAASYNVKRSSTSGGPYTTITVPGAQTGTTFSDTAPLSPNTTYYYVLTAVNASGESESSSEVPGLTAPAAPTGLTAMPGQNRISLAWTRSQGAAKYNVWRASSPAGTFSVIATVTSSNYTDSGLNSGAAYSYMVTAVNANGTEGMPSGPVSAAALIVLASFTLSPATVSGGMISAGVVTLSAPAPAGGMAVTLQSTTFWASVPGNVTVLAGSLSATFNVQSHPVTTPEDARLYASAGGVSIISTLHVKPAPLSSIVLSAGGVASGGSVGGVATLLIAAPSGGTVISLRSSNAAAIVPASVTVAAGSSTATFTVNTTTVTRSTPVTITATCAGASKTAALTVQPLCLASFTLNPPTVCGGQISKGTVTLTGPAPVGGMAVTLQSTTFWASVPSSITVLAGSSSTTFNVQSHPVTTPEDARLYASAGGVSVISTLHVIPAPLSSVVLSAGGVASGGSVGGVATLLTAAPSGGTVVRLFSSNAAAIVPASVTVAAGSSTATFTVNTTTVTRSTPATITATCAGASKTAALTVQPLCLASFTLNPPTVCGGQISKGTVTLTGPAPVGGMAVTLQSTTFWASVPSSITVLAGSSSTTFNVQSHPVTTPEDARLYASAGGVSIVSTLHVNPAPPPNITTVAVKAKG